MQIPICEVFGFGVDTFGMWDVPFYCYPGLAA